MNLSAMTTQPTAALAGVPSGIQSYGLCTGRRQVFVRFAIEGETAQMYTASALVKEIGRITSRAAFHSIGVTGRDPVGNSEFLLAALAALDAKLPVVLDTDGHRPERVASYRAAQGVSAIQVLASCSEEDAALERKLASLEAAAALGVTHAFVLSPAAETPDAVILRAIERVHATAAEATVILHPPAGDKATVLDRRWATLMEQAMSLHADVQLVLKVPPPAGLR